MSRAFLKRPKICDKIRMCFPIHGSFNGQYAPRVSVKSFTFSKRRLNLPIVRTKGGSSTTKYDLPGGLRGRRLKSTVYASGVFIKYVLQRTKLRTPWTRVSSCSLPAFNLLSYGGKCYGTERSALPLLFLIHISHLADCLAFKHQFFVDDVRLIAPRSQAQESR